MALRQKKGEVVGGRDVAPRQDGRTRRQRNKHLASVAWRDQTQHALVGVAKTLRKPKRRLPITLHAARMHAVAHMESPHFWPHRSCGVAGS